MADLLTHIPMEHISRPVLTARQQELHWLHAEQLEKAQEELSERRLCMDLCSGSCGFAFRNRAAERALETSEAPAEAEESEP